MKLPKYALIPGNPDRTEVILKELGRPTRISKNSPYPFYRALVGTRPVVVGATGLGSPNAAIAVEVLSHLGVRTFIRVGSTGALQPRIEVGDIIVALGAVRNEGTTPAFVPVEYPAVADYRVTLALQRACEKLGIKYDGGIVWTSDALFMGKDEYFDTMRKARVVSVEMESATLFTLCSLKLLRSGAILVVDGNLTTGSGLAGKFDPNLRKKFRAGERKAAKAAVEALKMLQKREIF